MNIFAKPEPQSNAAAIAAVSMLGVIGTILTNDISYAVAAGLGLVASCAISNTAFGKANFVETFVPQHITKEWAAAVAGAAIVGIACNPSIIGLGK